MRDIVHDNFTKITSSQWGNNTEGERLWGEKVVSYQRKLL